ncbi:uncharacterized protein LOC125489667 [Plutella xylostella]|uniref:uncharacterized protein LOC125489667 n=1 Tax=Plutella xylostella TaxID=51655 RepID=UPI002032D46B|nr:uncharacterized protein LOC125489667 [Plutella xylostella]
MGKTIHSKERALILKVLAFFEHEKKVSKFLIPVDPTKSANKIREHKKVNDSFIIPVDQPINRTCAATGISKSTLMRIKKQVRPVARSISPVPSTSWLSQLPGPSTEPSTPGKKRKSTKKINLDGFDLVALRNLVNSFYTVKKEIPTLKKILAAAKKDLNFQGERTTLRYILKNQLGYKFKKCKNARLVLIQKPDITAWRARYLRRMRENNKLGPNKKPVTYLDETWIHSHYTVKKCLQNSSDATLMKNTNAGQCWILVHAGGEYGFVPGAELLYKCKNKTGDYQNEMDTNFFVKWLSEKLLPNLPPNGLVVIDNAPYHSTQSEKIPCQSSLKSEMQSWLTKNNISFDQKMTKPELYHIIRLNKPEKKYVVDDLLREHGHEVVRLPPYHCDLNPIEYIWNLIKQRLADKNIDQSEKLFEQWTREAIKSITVEDWKKEVDHIQRLEEEYWVKDRLQEHQERQFIKHLGGEESSSDSESEEEEYESDMSVKIEELSDD